MAVTSLPHVNSGTKSPDWLTKPNWRSKLPPIAKKGWRVTKVQKLWMVKCDTVGLLYNDDRHTATMVAGVLARITGCHYAAEPTTVTFWKSERQ